ncbi:hypothetical protein GGP41_000588 [Bipolaris sorokiniana]|uniref:NAD(P)-binding domain-containing protein n=2 Tax=Cochliobolus sativus TaxID=45130 RepID=A0A8H5ZPA1_COCSA|nr:uncharacterized protein COCSADRAFT_41460 [Bipolaris sorokiniana ND90Pr]EMD58898.1 hypothetical protein COCSADRAFT_41460 [Bipolaris sorokiniana ND90Pr]KAF5851809.1 hypothetical protein GGP41_000588 [Bipolaris sorokiniana]
MLRQQMNEVDLLILGAGWTSTFLIPQLSDTDITYAATTTSGRDATIPFKFEPESGDAEPYKRLPAAKTVVITFPLVGHGQSKSLVGLYRSVHGARNNWIQLGSTGIYNKVPDDWSDEDAHYNKEDKRAVAEDELRSLHGCVLCLAGLYGGERVPARWLPRIVKSKDDIKKRGAVHFIHGEDVAQAIIATHQKFSPGKRWIVSDLRVYDWYDLIMSFSSMTESSMSQEEKETQQQYAKWVGELMQEEDIRALPRDVSSLGRKLDSRRFWAYHGLLPRHRRLA